MTELSKTYEPQEMEKCKAFLEGKIPVEREREKFVNNV